MFFKLQFCTELLLPQSESHQIYGKIDFAAEHNLKTRIFACSGVYTAYMKIKIFLGINVKMMNLQGYV